MFVKQGVDPDYDENVEQTAGASLPEGNLGYWYFSADEIHLFDNFNLEDGKIIFDFNKDNWMEISGSGLFKNNGIIEKGSLSDFSISGDITIRSASDLLLLENSIIEPGSQIRLHIENPEDGGRVLLNSISVAEDCTIVVSGDVNSVVMTGCIFEKGSKIFVPDECETGSFSCIYNDPDIIKGLKIDNFEEFQEANEFWEELDDKLEPDEDWMLPLLSLAAAGLMGIFKKKNLKAQKQQVKQTQKAYAGAQR